MSVTFREQPALRHRDQDMIPRRLLRAMLCLPVMALVIVGGNAVSGRATVGQPHAGTIVAERSIILEGRGQKAVAIRDSTGGVLTEMENGGFVTVVQNGLARARKVAGVDPDLPVRLIRYDNGRLSIQDDISGWSAELHAFGDLNQAAFDRLMPN